MGDVHAPRVPEELGFGIVVIVDNINCDVMVIGPVEQVLHVLDNLKRRLQPARAFGHVVASLSQIVLDREKWQESFVEGGEVEPEEGAGEPHEEVLDQLKKVDLSTGMWQTKAHALVGVTRFFQC